MFVTDVDKFVEEISEQKYLFNIASKFKKLSEKELVGQRYNEQEVIDKQKEYFKSFRPYNYSDRSEFEFDDTIDYEDIEDIENKEIANNVRNLIKENRKRQKVLLKEGRALIIGNFNRII